MNNITREEGPIRLGTFNGTDNNVSVDPTSKFSFNNDENRNEQQSGQHNISDVIAKTAR